MQCWNLPLVTSRRNSIRDVVSGLCLLHQTKDTELGLRDLADIFDTESGAAYPVGVFLERGQRSFGRILAFTRGRIALGRVTPPFAG